MGQARPCKAPQLPTAPLGPSPCSAEAALLLSLTTQSTVTTVFSREQVLHLSKGSLGESTEEGSLVHSLTPQPPHVAPQAFFPPEACSCGCLGSQTPSPHHYIIGSQLPTMEQYFSPSQTHIRNLSFHVSSGDRALGSRTEEWDPLNG